MFDGDRKRRLSASNFSLSDFSALQPREKKWWPCGKLHQRGKWGGSGHILIINHRAALQFTLRHAEFMMLWATCLSRPASPGASSQRGRFEFLLKYFISSQDTGWHGSQVNLYWDYSRVLWCFTERPCLSHLILKVPGNQVSPVVGGPGQECWTRRFSLGAAGSVWSLQEGDGSTWHSVVLWPLHSAALISRLYHLTRLRWHTDKQ